MRVGAGIREHLGASQEVADAKIAEIGRFDVKISGCPNSCGQHHVGDVGLTGIVHKEPDGSQSEYYSIRLGGAIGPEVGIGVRLQKRYPEDDTPKVIAALAEHYRQHRRAGESFRAFVLRVGEPELGKVAAAASPRGI
jgi:sulfite reductase beta subunit-like hemoprotein